MPTVTRRGALALAALLSIHLGTWADQSLASGSKKANQVELPADMQDALRKWAIQAASPMPQMVGPRGYGVPPQMEAAIANLKAGDELPYGFKPMDIDELFEAIRRDRPPLGPKTKFETKEQYEEREYQFHRELGINPADTLVVVKFNADEKSPLEYDPERQGWYLTDFLHASTGHVIGPAHSRRTVMRIVGMQNHDVVRQTVRDTDFFIPMEGRIAEMVERNLSVLLIGRLIPPVLTLDAYESGDMYLLWVEASSILVIHNKVLGRLDLPTETAS